MSKAWRDWTKNEHIDEAERILRQEPHTNVNMRKAELHVNLAAIKQQQQAHSLGVQRKERPQ